MVWLQTVPLYHRPVQIKNRTVLFPFVVLWPKWGYSDLPGQIHTKCPWQQFFRAASPFWWKGLKRLVVESQSFAYITCCCIGRTCAPEWMCWEMSGCAICVQWFEGRLRWARWAPGLGPHSPQWKDLGGPVSVRAGATAWCKACLFERRNWSFFSVWLLTISVRHGRCGYYSVAHPQPGGTSSYCSPRLHWYRCRRCFLCLQGPQQRWSECSVYPDDSPRWSEPSPRLLVSENMRSQLSQSPDKSLSHALTLLALTDLVANFHVTL